MNISTLVVFSTRTIRNISLVLVGYVRIFLFRTLAMPEKTI